VRLVRYSGVFCKVVDGLTSSVVDYSEEKLLHYVGGLATEPQGVKVVMAETDGGTSSPNFLQSVPSSPPFSNLRVEV